MHDLAHDFTNKKISLWGGMKYFYKTYIASGLREDLEGARLPQGDSNAAYNAVDMMEGFMVGAVLGSKRMVHTSMLGTDEVIRELFGWRRGVASQSTFSRFFRRFDTAYNDQLFNSLMRSWWSRMHIKKMTIDIDSTVLTRHGSQEGAEIGYNPMKNGRPSHHPLMAFCAELKMVVHSWMRPGNTHDSNGVDCFLSQLFEILSPKRIGLIRADSGFYSREVMHELEEAEVDYIIRAKMTKKLLSKVLEIDQWHANQSVFKDAQYAEIFYQASTWLTERRAVVVRRPKASTSNRQVSGLLFREDQDLKEYEYSVYVTSTELSCAVVHDLYNKRADCENRIKELKYDYGIDGFTMKDIGATEAAFRTIMMAYNVMSLFKQKVLTSPVSHHLSTVRFQCIAIGSYLVKNGRKKVMMLSAEGKRRHFLEHIFEKVELLEPPFKFSNA
jgi:hypothetical protein